MISKCVFADNSFHMEVHKKFQEKELRLMDFLYK